MQDKRRVQQREKIKSKTIRVDTQTGEYLGQEKTSVIKTVRSNESFIFAFNDYEIFKNLSPSELSILFYCAHNCQFNTNAISLLSYDKKNMAEMLSLTEGTVRIMISKLKKKDYLHSLGGGKYRVNPLYFYKGDLGKRERLLTTTKTEEFNV